MPHVLPYVDGCPEPLAIDHVIEAARIFCARTLVWSYECDPIPSGAGEREYALQLAEGQDLVRLVNVHFQGCDYDVRRASVGRAAGRHALGGRCAYMNGPMSFSLHPTPGVDDAPIVTEIVVKPSLTATEWPDDLAEYIKDIAGGAIATLSEMPRQAWTDVNVAISRTGRFEARVLAVKGEVERGYGRSKRPSVSSFL